MVVKGVNEAYLFEILNKAYPGKWISEFKGIEAMGINKRGKEFKRRFAFDCANPTDKIAIEIEGGVWLGKGHTGGLHYQQDMEKYNLATLEGWRILRYTPETLNQRHWRIISDIRQLCGYPEDNKTTQIDLTGCKQGTLGQVQVKLGV